MGHSSQNQGGFHARTVVQRRRYGASISADDHGNVAMMLAIAAIPVLGAAGAAIDYSRAIQARGELQRAVDAAALAAAKMSDASVGERKKLVNTLVENRFLAWP